MSRKETHKEILGLNRITKKRILELCKKDKLYQTPELNDVLYLHYQGFDCIECLEDYTELKCLWLESNAISEIQGLDKQTKLKCLFLQSNLIRKIENLEYCKELDTLNLSQNHIRKIENCGFEVLPVLNTLNLASNYLKDCEALKELENCKTLSVLDLSNNRIDDILVVKIFSQMPELKVLILQGNPVVSKIPQYRKTLILECKKLTYLDLRPIFPKDRACAEAWKRGGYEEERKENERWNRKERKKMRDSVNATIHLRNKYRKVEDQISLILSSDSEDDTKAQNKHLRIRVDSEASMNSVWDEVADEKSSDRYLVSSDRSRNYQEAGDSKINYKEHIEGVKNQQFEAKEDLLQESSSIEKALTNEVTGSSFQAGINENKNSQVSNLKDFEIDQDNYEIEIEGVKNQQFEAKEDMLQESSNIEKELTNGVRGSSFQAGINENSEARMDTIWDGITEEKYDKSLICTAVSNNNEETIETIKEQTGNEDRTPDMLKVSSSLQSELNRNISQYSMDENTKLQQNYETLIENTDQIPELEDNTASLFQNPTENIKVTEGNNDDIYEPFKELDECMKIFSQQAAHDTASERKTEPQPEQKVEEKYLKVNNQIESDFEKLTTNFGHFLNQLEKEQEERQEVMKAIFCQEVGIKESSCESSDNEDLDVLEKLKLERVVDQWDNETKIKNVNIKKKETQKITKKEQKYAGEVHDNLKHRFLADEEKTSYVEFQEDQVIESSTNVHNKEGSKSFEYTPMDISFLTLKSNEALNLLEKESKELKELLQKLENNNEEIFKGTNLDGRSQGLQKIEQFNLQENENTKSNFVNKNYEIFNKNIQQDANGSTFYYKKEETVQEELTEIDEEDKKEIVKSIITEILKSLDVMHFQQKYFEFPADLVEESGGHDLLSPKKHEETGIVSRSIPHVIESFNQFFNKMKLNLEQKETCSLETLNKQKQNSLISEELSEQSNLKQSNVDTLETIDVQLAEIKSRQHEKVRRMVDRMYSQNDCYNDTLELVDGKLMVRNQYTAKLDELPPPLQRRSSNSEDDYDTAESEEDLPNNEIVIKEHFNRKFFKPTARKSSEDLVTRALIENCLNKSNDNSDQSNDEYYSLDSQVKPKLLNIDKELFDDLSFDFSNFNKIDENHIVQCARSYEEIKHYFTHNKEEKSITEQEKESLEDMMYKNENQKIITESSQYNGDLSTEEQLWFKKVAPKTKNSTNESSCMRLFEKNLKKPIKTLQRPKNEEYLNENWRQESILINEPQSAKEKQEVEYSVQLEEDIPFIVKEECIPDEPLLQKSINMEILECNLEIIGDNNDIVDTITVNAELHF